MSSLPTGVEITKCYKTAQLGAWQQTQSGVRGADNTVTGSADNTVTRSVDNTWEPLL